MLIHRKDDQWFLVIPTEGKFGGEVPVNHCGYGRMIDHLVRSGSLREHWVRKYPNGRVEVVRPVKAKVFDGIE